MPKIIHNDWKSPLFKIWCGMKYRCLNKNSTKYHRYGGRGIKVSDEWIDDFVNFRDWSYENGYKKGLTIDRINNDGNYEPSNCRWITNKEQYKTRSGSILVEKNNETKTINEWCQDLGIWSETIYYRIKKKNMNPYQALFECDNTSLKRRKR